MVRTQQQREFKLYPMHNTLESHTLIIIIYTCKVKLSKWVILSVVFYFHGFDILIFNLPTLSIKIYLMNIYFP